MISMPTPSSGEESRINSIPVKSQPLHARTKLASPLTMGRGQRMGWIVLDGPSMALEETEIRVR